MARVFISHSSRDNALAEDMKRWLAEQGFEQAFLDIDKHSGIPPGANWERVLYEKIVSSQAMILVGTPNWHESKWCFVEFAQARALGKPIFPVIHTPGGERLVAPDIQQLDLRPDRQGGLDRLARELWVLTNNAQGGFEWDGTRPCYPGLAAFEQEDAAVFFGRDDDVRGCIEQLNARRIHGVVRTVLLLGASGSGKSSVMRAGVLPRIAKDRRNWIVMPPFRPGHDPLSTFARAVSEALGTPAAWRAWRDRFAAPDFAAPDFAAPDFAAPGPDAVLEDLADSLRTHALSCEAQVLVTIDQGEELFTLTPPADVQAFFALLQRMTGGPASFLVLFCIRSDFLDRFQRAAGDLRFSPRSLGPFPLSRVREVIEGPAKIAGLGIDEALVATAVADMHVPDALPLLAFTLRELYDHATSAANPARKPDLTLAQYRSLGDAARGLSPLENAVQRRAQEVIHDLALQPEDMQALREAFVGHMVRVNDEGLYDRRPADWTVLPERARPILEALARARLVSVRQAEKTTLVEAAHEALLRTWTLLRGWLDAERDFLVGRRQLQVALGEWQRSSRAQSDQALLHGLLLSRARTWLLDHPYALTIEEKSFITASIAFSDAESRAALRRRQGAWLLGGVAAVGVLAAVFLQQQQAQAHARAEAAAMVVRAREHLADGRAREALIEAAQAMERDDTVAARSVLLEALLATPPFLDRSLRTGDLRPGVLAWSPGSDALAIGGAGRIVVWRPQGSPAATTIDVGGGQVVQSLRVVVRALAWDETGLRAALADGQLLLGSGRDAAMPSRPLGVTDQVKRAALVPTGPVLAAMFREAEVNAFHCPTEPESPCRAVLVATGYPAAMSLTPGGKLAALGYDDGSVRLSRTDDGTAAPSPWTGKAAIRALCWNEAGNRLAVDAADGELAILDQKGDLIASIREGGGVSSLAWDRRGGRVAGTCGDRSICIWARDEADPAGMFLRRIAHLPAGADEVSGLAWSPDGQKLASSSGDTVQIWSVGRHDGASFTLDLGGGAAVSDVVVAPNANWLATGDDEGGLHLFSLPRFSAAPSIHDERISTVKGLAWSPGGVLAVLEGNGHMFTIKPLGDAAALEVPLQADDVQALAWLPDGDAVLTGGSLGGALEQAALTDAFIRPFPRRHGEAVTALAVSPNGSKLLSADASGSIRLWDIGTRSAAAPIATGSGRGTAKFSHDGESFLVAGNDGNVLVYRTADIAQTPRACGSGSTMLDDAAFSEDGKAVYGMGGDRTPRLYIWTLDDKCDLLATAPIPSSGGAPAAAGRERRRVATIPRFPLFVVAASSPRLLLISPDPKSWRQTAHDLGMWQQSIPAPDALSTASVQ